MILMNPNLAPFYFHMKLKLQMQNIYCLFTFLRVLLMALRATNVTNIVSQLRHEVAIFN